MQPIDSFLPELWIHVLPAAAPFPTLTRALLAMTCHKFDKDMCKLPRLAASPKGKRHPVWVDWRDDMKERPIRVRARTMALCILTGEPTLANWALVEPDWLESLYSFSTLMSAVAMDSIPLARHLRACGSSTFNAVRHDFRNREVNKTIGRFAAFRVLEYLKLDGFHHSLDLIFCKAIKYGRNVPDQILITAANADWTALEALAKTHQYERAHLCYPASHVEIAIEAAKFGHVEVLTKCIEIIGMDLWPASIIDAAICHPDSIRCLLKAQHGCQYMPNTDFDWDDIHWSTASAEALELLHTTHSELVGHNLLRSPRHGLEQSLVCLSMKHHRGTDAFDWLIAHAKSPADWPDLDPFLTDAALYNQASTILHYMIKRGCPVSPQQLAWIRSHGTASDYYFADWCERQQPLRGGMKK